MPDPETLAELSWPDIRKAITEWLIDERPAECVHENRALRRRILADGRVAYCGQCTDCGKAFNNISKQAAIEKAGGRLIKDFDNELAERERSLWHDRWTATNEQAEGLARRVREIKNARWWARYNNHLQSDAWKTIRQRVMQRANNRCEGCSVARATQVHHLTYDRVGEEMLFDLVAICDACHERVHTSVPVEHND